MLFTFVLDGSQNTPGHGGWQGSFERFHFLTVQLGPPVALYKVTSEFFWYGRRAKAMGISEKRRSNRGSMGPRRKGKASPSSVLKHPKLAM